MQFKELRAENVLLYKDARFNLNHKGISVIYGDNRDAGRGSTNAAGKSLFFSQIPALIGIIHPVSKKPSKLERGKSTLTLVRNKKEYKIVKLTKKGREKIRLFVDGRNIEAARKGYVQKKIESLHGWTEDEFYSTVYIDSRRPNPLHLGSTKQRRDFVISMFRLSNVDNLRKVFNAELRRISEDRSAYEEIKRQYKSLSEQLVDESELELKEKVERLEKTYKKLSTRVERATEIRELLVFKRENKETIVRLLKLTNWNLDNVERFIETIKKKSAELEMDLEEAIAWTKHKDKVATYTASSEKILKKLKKYKDLSVEDAKKGAALYEKARYNLEIVEDAIKSNIEKLPEKVHVDKDILKRDGDKLRADFRNYRELFEQAKKFKRGTCPLCKSPVKVHDRKSLVKKLRTLKRQLSEIDSARLCLEQRTERIKIKKLIKEFKEKESIYVKRLDKYWRYKKANHWYNKLPETPKPFEGKKIDEKEVREKLNKCNKRISFLTTMLPMVDKIKRARNLSEEEKQESYYLDTLRTRLGRVVDNLPSTKSAYDKIRIVRSELEKLKERAKELQGSVKDEQAFELLVEAYGNSGIKRMMLQRIGSHLEACLNRYARFVFSERYDFKVNIDTQFDILVKRKLANRTLVSDVRQLSGAESKAFVLLLYLSLLSLLPAARRSNILVLDEPDANLGPEMRENLKRFIPILNKIVPHIIIITPHTDMRYDGAKNFTVVKEKGYSKIVETV